MIVSVLIALMAGVIGYVYSQLLTAPEMILNGLYKYLDSKIGKYEFIFKPLIGCEKCVAGQLALWGNIIYFTHCNNISFEFYLILKTISIVIFSICLSILIAWILRKS